MKPRPTIIWGSVSALLAAAALAQQPGSQPATQPASQSYPLTNSVDTRGMLSDLAGLFRVDLRINPNQWYGNTAMLNPDGTPASTGQVGGQVGGQGGVTNQNGTVPGATPANSGVNTPRAINNQSQPGQVPGATRDPSMQPGDLAAANSMASSSALNGAVSVRGYSEKRWTLGGNILQETCIVPDLAAVVSDMNEAQGMGNGQGNTTGRNAANMPGGTGAENAATGSNDDLDAGLGRPSMEALEANRMFQGVSYLSFNPQTNAIVLTSMDSRQSDVLNATGQFLPGMNRVEFAVNPSAAQMGLANNQFGSAQMANGQVGNMTGNPAANNPNNFNAQTDPNRAAPNTPSTTGNTNNTSNPNTTANQPGSNAGNPATRTGNQPANRNAANTGSNQPNDPNRLQQTRDQNAINAGSNGFAPTSSLNASAGAFDNVRVVLEFISPDQHRVTLYRLNPGANGDMYQNPYYVPQNTGMLDANGRRVDAQGRLVDGQGRLVDDQGRLVDAQGRLVDAQGRLIDSQGRVLDASGRPIDPNNQGNGQNNNGDPNIPNSNPATDPNNPNTRQPQPGDATRPATNVPNDPSRPRATGSTPATTGGQPPNTVTDAPGTRPNNTEPTSGAQPGNQTGTNTNRGTNTNNQTGQPTQGNQPNQTGQPGTNQPGMTPNQPGVVINQPGTNGTGNVTNLPGQFNNQFNQAFPGNISAGDQGTWVVIWEATYTRVDGAEASRYRNYLQRADQLIQASIRDDNER